MILGSNGAVLALMSDTDSTKNNKRPEPKIQAFSLQPLLILFFSEFESTKIRVFNFRCLYEAIAPMARLADPEGAVSENGSDHS